MGRRLHIYESPRPGNPCRFREAARLSGSNSTSAAERDGRRGKRGASRQRLGLIHGHESSLWAAMLSALQAQAEAAGKIGWTVSVDSMISRAQQHAASLRCPNRLPTLVDSLS